MYKISSLFGGLLLLLNVPFGQAQHLGNSPYSQQGIGMVNENTGNIRNFGMGNVGVSTPNTFHVNFVNPALLYYNSRVTFEMAAAGQVKNIASTEKSQTGGTASLGYLALAVPISKGWRAAVGLQPFSSVNYQSFSESTVAGDPNKTQVQTGAGGEGTISEAYFANGFKIYKGLSAGVSTSYLFGVIDRNASALLLDTATASRPERLVVNEQFSYGDFMFKGGLAYRQELNKKVSLNLGATYGLKTDLNYERRTVQERRRVDESVIDQNALNDTTRSQATLPGILQLGLSLDNNRSWVAGVEFSSRKWSDFRSGTGKAGDESLADSYRISAGGEYTPDAGSMNSYFNRVSYRAGVSYTKTPINLQGTQLNDIAVHTGLSLPLGTTPRPPEYNQSAVNIGLAFGKNGTTANNLLRENYVRFNIGISLNSSWFLKPRID
jgi:hypothetical protein